MNQTENHEEDEGYSIQDVLECDNYQKMLEIHLYLVQNVSDLHRKKRLAQTSNEQREIQEELSVAYAAQNTAKDRLELLKREDADKYKEQNRINYNFHKAAKSYLNRDTYELLLEKAHMKLSDMKAEVKETKPNKLAR